MYRRSIWVMAMHFKILWKTLQIYFVLFFQRGSFYEFNAWAGHLKKKKKKTHEHFELSRALCWRQHWDLCENQKATDMHFTFLRAPHLLFFTIVDRFHFTQPEVVLTCNTTHFHRLGKLTTKLKHHLHFKCPHLACTSTITFNKVIVSRYKCLILYLWTITPPVGARTVKLLYKQMNDNIVINHVFIEEVIIVENVLMSAHN